MALVLPQVGLLGVEQHWVRFLFLQRPQAWLLALDLHSFALTMPCTV